MDRIEIRGLRAFGRHGVYAEEKRTGQTFVLDVTLERDLAEAARNDDLAATVDYGRLARMVAEEVERSRFTLIEALAVHLADLILGSEKVVAVTVRVAKPDAPMTVHADEVAVVVRRTAAG